MFAVESEVCLSWEGWFPPASQPVSQSRQLRRAGEPSPPVFPVPRRARNLREPELNKHAVGRTSISVQIQTPASTTQMAALGRADGHAQSQAALACIRTIGGMQTKIVSTGFGGQRWPCCQRAHSAWPPNHIRKS